MDRNKLYLYRILYSALIQIREDAHESGNKNLFWISDLLHNLPLKLMKDDANYDELFDDLVKAAKHNKIDRWLDNEVKIINENF